ncbi:MAG: hypothetical protein ABH834_00130 [Candidatus Altiarchaeota archaeon]
MNAQRLVGVSKVLIVVLVFLVYARFFPSPTFFDNFRESRCVDYFSEGVLYGGQPYCFHGPIEYLYGYFFLSFFGFKLFWEVMPVMVIIMNFHLFYLIWRVLKIEVGEFNHFYLALLFIILIFFQSFGNDYSVLSTVFLFNGFFFLYYSKNENREWYAGTFFSFAVFSLITSLIPICIILLSHIYLTGIINPCYLKKGDIKKFLFNIKFPLLIPLFSPMLLMYFFFIVRFPNMLVYLFRLSFMPSNSFTETLRIMLIPKNIEFASIMLAIILSGVVFFKRRCVFSSCSSIGMFFSVFYILKSAGSEHVPIYYLLPFYPMVIISLIKLGKMAESRIHARVCFQTFLVLILILPGLIRTGLVAEADYLRWLVDQPLRFIPKQSAVLVEGDIIKLNAENLDVIPLNYAVVEEFTNKSGRLSFMDHLRYKLPRHDWYSLTKREIAYVENIRNGSYALIADGPPFWWTISRIESFAMNHINKHYYAVYVPNQYFLSHGGRHNVELLFRNKSHAEYMRTMMLDYYEANFDRICQIDAYTAENIIPNVLEDNKILFYQKCVGGGDLTNDFNERRFYFQQGDIGLVLIMFGSLLLIDLLKSYFIPV